MFQRVRVKDSQACHADFSATGILNDYLRSILELVLNKTKKGTPVRLAVTDKTLGSAIKSELSIECDASDSSLDLIRGVRLHAERLLKGMQEGDMIKAQLGLGHSYSRAKIKFNVNRSDNMIIQAIALLDQLDKDVNTFAMRIREWYGYHFPELIRIVPENHLYARAAKFIGNKTTLTEDKLPDLVEVLEDDETRAKNVLDAARTSMGSELSEIDMINIFMFAERVISLAEYRKSLTSYLTEKMNQVAPSLTALIGERIGARLISHAGSLTNLSKYPASTVQILGAEKALFRALKTKGNTPKVFLFVLRPHPCSDLNFTSVWSHLPFILHRQSRAKVQRSHLSIPGEQIINCVKNRLFLRYAICFTFYIAVLKPFDA